MRWIVTGVALAVVTLVGVDVARACGGCCQGGGRGCPSCPQGGSASGPARPAAPAACPNCPQPDAASGAYRYPNGGPGYTPRYTASTSAVTAPVATQPVVPHSTSYRAAPRPVETTSRYERPAR